MAGLGPLNLHHSAPISASAGVRESTVMRFQGQREYSVVDGILTEVFTELRRQSEDERLFGEPLLAGDRETLVDQIIQYSLH